MKENKHTLLSALESLSYQIHQLADQQMAEIDRDLLLEDLRSFYLQLKTYPLDKKTDEKPQVCIQQTHEPEEEINAEENDLPEVREEESSAPQQEEIKEIVLEEEAATEPTLLFEIEENDEPEEENQPQVEASPMEEEQPQIEEEPQSKEASSVEEEVVMDEELIPDTEKIEAEEKTSEVPPTAETPELLSYLEQRKNTQSQTSGTRSAIDLLIEKQTQTVADKYQTAQNFAESLTDNTASGSVLSQLEKKANDLRQDIGINEKFMFINDLFSGDLEAYNHFISQINGVLSLDEAQIILEQNAQERQWSRETDAYISMQSILEKKLEI